MDHLEDQEAMIDSDENEILIQKKNWVPPKITLLRDFLPEGGIGPGDDAASRS